VPSVRTFRITDASCWVFMKTLQRDRIAMDRARIHLRLGQRNAWRRRVGIHRHTQIAIYRTRFRRHEVLRVVVQWAWL
jgi:hypothetical protein